MELLKFLKFKDKKQRSLSLDFSAGFIKVACVEASGGNYRLLAFASIEFDATGKTVQQISLSLQQLLKANAIASGEVALSVSNPDEIFIKKLTLPLMPKDELLNAAKWQLKGQLPFNADDSVADLQIIREYVDSQEAKKVEFFCVFAKKETINKYVAVATACGLTPVKVSSSVFNYSGALNLISANPEISAILEVGQAHSQVSIYQKNKLSFVRDLNFSTLKLTASLIGALVTDSGKIEINLQKAGELLSKFGIPLDETRVLEGGIKASHIISLIRPLLETVVKELGRSFEYAKSESGLDIPAVLYLTGEGANLINFDRYLMEALKIKVDKLPLAQRLDTKNVDQDKLQLKVNQLSGVLSLSLSNAGINLLPADIKYRKIELIQKTSLRIIAISIGAVFVFSWFVINFQSSDYKKRLIIAKAHLQSVQEVKNLKTIVDLRENLINTIHIGKVPSGGLLKLISAIIPPGIILDEFSLDQPNHAMWLKGVVIVSKDSVEKTLTDFMNDLESSKFIQDANLISSKEEEGINNFQIKCELAK